MLSRRTLAAAGVVAVLTLAAPSAGLAAPAPTPSTSAGCDPVAQPWCQVEGGDPGGGGDDSGGDGGGHGCTWHGTKVPCQDPDLGYYVGGGCYWKRLDPPPPDLTPPAGHDPATGAWGVRSCYSAPGSGSITQTFQWLDDPPDPLTPAQLAQHALAKIHLLGAAIGIAPSAMGSGLVGLPVWMWTAVSAGTWGPISASASDGGITVTITARAQRIVWSMGDGHEVSCANPGTPYQARYGNTASPTCGYRYAKASTSAREPHGRYTVTATTRWRAQWSGGGQSGLLTPTSTARTSIEIDELQVVTQ